MAEEAVNMRSIMVYFGMGRPVARAFVAGSVATLALYAAGFPKAAFREDGTMCPFSPLCKGPDGVCAQHFLVLPVTVATAVFLFT